jgi:3-isopropylmalate dehydrogenase
METVSSYKVGLIGGDGIGPEVVAEAIKVVEAAGISLSTTNYDLGADRYVRTGDILPDSVLAELTGQDAILLGAVGPPVGSTSVPSGALERGLLLRLRFELDLYVNMRPFTGVPGAPAPDCDFVVIRENTEGTYAGEGGFLRKGTPYEVATQGSVNTRHGVERCVRFAFGLASTRPRRKLTLVHKTNVLTFAGDLWQRTVDEVSSDYEDVSRDYNHVDATCIYLVENPGRYDVIVTDNLFGDIITDLAGAIAGGIGYAASANLNPDRTGPSLFEPVHGAAHDIAGTGKANPAAAIRSAALMLDFLGESAAATKVTQAVTDFITSQPEPTLSTAAIGDAIAERL